MKEMRFHFELLRTSQSNKRWVTQYQEVVERLNQIIEIGNSGERRNYAIRRAPARRLLHAAPFSAMGSTARLPGSCVTE